MEEKNRKKNSMAGAGFLIFKKDTVHLKNPKMLALVRSDGQLDIPKGSLDGNESLLDAAKRECFEECSIAISNDELLFSGKPHKNDQLAVFCAATDKVPLITKNPETGIQEHESFMWIDREQFCDNCLNYLITPINHFYSAHSDDYNDT